MFVPPIDTVRHISVQSQEKLSYAPSDVNEYHQKISDEAVTAKYFRT